MFVRTRSFATFANKQCRLVKRPTGLPTNENWSIGTEQTISPKAGGILVKTSALSLDPAMRGWMNDGKSYIPPVEINAVMRAGGIGTIVESNNATFNVGDTVAGMLNVQEYATIEESEIRRAGIAKVDLSLGSQSQWLNILGMPGMTAYFGLTDIAKPVSGETLVVSGASGAVGQTVGQLAKVLGLRVVGIAGGEQKCKFVTDELGFDACIDYKRSKSAVYEGLREHCPKGVDIYFDNVGGDILDSVLARINRKARIVICGAISQYNSTTGPAGPKNYLSLLVNRARMEGMVVFDYAPRYGEAISALAVHLKTGHIKSREDIVTGGVDAFPDSLNMLFTGKNFGKLVLKI